MSLQGPPYRLVGQWAGVRLEAPARISGQFKLGADWNLPNQAYLKVKLSTIPSGTIASMDASAARAMPGVLAVVTPSDVQNNAAWSKIKVGTYPLLPYDRIRHAGEVIAAVVAEDPYVAEEACQAINVTYNPSPFVLAPEDAIASSAPLVNPPASNESATVTYKFGDAATAMTQPGITQLSSRYESALIQHNNIMPHAFTISVDTTGRVEMYTATQASKTHASDLATALGVSASRVRVYSLSSDGGFGDKGDAGGGYTAFPPEILAAILSQQLGRPVHHRWTHEENLLVSLHRSKVVFYITTGYNSSGTVMALTAQGYGTGSPYTSSSSNASGALNNFIWTYKFPNFTLNGNDGHANTYRQGPMRNPASPHPAWALSSHLDMVAAALGINPVTMMQANNMYTQGDKDQLTGYRIISIGQPDCLNRVLTLSGFMSKWKAFNKSTPLTGVVHGIGIANHATGNGGTAAAETGAIMMAADGSFNILIDNNSVGGGGRERNIIIAAEALGLPLGMVTMDNGDTDCGIDTGNTVGSGATKHVGDVIGLACLDAKSQMLARAATLLNTTTDKLTYALDGTMQIYVTATPTQSVTFAQLGGYPRIVGRGTMTLPPSTTGRVYNSAVSEVDVDTDTGLVTVTDVYQVEDIGQKIFNSGCDTQMKSGILMALGMALQEEQWPDVPTGMQLMTSHLDIKNPLVTQMPNMVVDFIQNPELPPDSYNFGAKGMGEPPINPSVPATANAIYNAVGARIYNLPMTCDKILKALGKA